MSPAWSWGQGRPGREGELSLRAISVQYRGRGPSWDRTVISLQGAKAKTLPASLGAGGAGLGPSLVGRSDDFRGPESEASWTQGLGAGKVGAGRGASHPSKLPPPR